MHYCDTCKHLSLEEGTPTFFVCVYNPEWIKIEYPPKHLCSHWQESADVSSWNKLTETLK